MMSSFSFLPNILRGTILLAGLAACSPIADEAKCTDNVVGSVATVSSARTGTVGTPIPVNYVVNIPNSCGQFVELREQKDGNKTYLAPLVRYEGCTCPAVKSDYQGTYQFTATQPGKYIILFPNSTTQVVTDTITIQ